MRQVRRVVVLVAVAAVLLGSPILSADPMSALAAGSVGGAVFTESAFRYADGTCQMALPAGFTAAWWQASPISPDGSRIVVTEEGYPYNAQLYVVDLAAKESTLISANLREVKHPSWSPDGTKVAFSAHPVDGLAVIVTTADGTSPFLLALRAQWPAWSPTDSNAVAFVRDNHDLVVADPSNPSAPPQLVVDGDSIFIHQFRWLPDGSGFTYHRSESADDYATGHLWYASKDGSVTYEITEAEGWGHIYDAAVSPDGSKVLFNDWQKISDGLGGYWYIEGLFMVGVDGTGLVRLEPSVLPTKPSEVTFHLEHLGWLDNTHIAYGFQGDMVIRDLNTSDPPVPLAADQDWVWSSPVRPLCTPEVAFSSEGGFDGWVLEQDEASGKGGTFDATATSGRVGDDASDRQWRSILHFDTATLPDNAVITSVTLRIKKQSMVGTNPFTTHGFLTVDMRTGAFHDNPVLEKLDFQAVGSRGNVGRFIRTPALGWYRAPLRAVAYPLINLTGSTQFRLRFATDDNDDLGADYLSFYTGEAAEADRPELIVSYYIP